MSAVTPPTDQFVDECRRIVREVMPIIMEAVSQSARTASKKSDGSLVTSTDHAVEGYFVRELERAFPKIAVLGEEMVSAHSVSAEEVPQYYARFMEAPLQIIIDPIDGTKNFVEGRREFCIAAALTKRVNHGVWPIAGIVAIPVAGFMYFSDSRGVFREDIHTGAREPIHRNASEELCVSASSRDRWWLATHHYALSHPWISSGSSVHDFLGTATGTLSGSVIGAQRLWDLMAPLAIAERLGCHLLDLETGAPIHEIVPADLSPELLRRPWGLMRRMMLLSPDLKVGDLICTSPN